MNRGNKRSPAPSQVRQPFKRQAGTASRLKPLVVQPKTSVSMKTAKSPIAPPAYRQQPVPKVLQTKRSSGQIPSEPVSVRASALKAGARKPAAPPVYRPQPVPKVLQRKSALPAGTGVSPRPSKSSPGIPVVRPGKIVQTKSVIGPANARTGLRTRWMSRGVLQRAVAPPKAITKEGLLDDDYLFVGVASGGFSEPPANTVSKMNVRILRLDDVDYRLTAKHIIAVLANPAANRNATSICPVHNNEQERLPTYPAAVIAQSQMQPNLEYFVKGLGACRIVVDIAARKVYLSHHYGDQAAKEGKVPEKYKKEKISAFVELDGTWALGPILADARAWWDGFCAHAPGT